VVRKSPSRSLPLQPEATCGEEVSKLACKTLTLPFDAFISPGTRDSVEMDLSSMPDDDERQAVLKLLGDIHGKAEIAASGGRGSSPICERYRFNGLYAFRLSDSSNVAFFERGRMVQPEQVILIIEIGI
jgi:hypothetical protein